MIVHRPDGTEADVVIDNPNGGWTRTVQWVAADLFLTADEDGTVTLRAVDGSAPATLDVGSGVLDADLWLGPAVLLATAHQDGAVRLWDLATGDLVAEPAPPTDADATSVDWSPDGQRLAAGWLNGTVGVWRLDGQ